ncbi:MAG: hypothetical protein WEC14_10270 [Chloroflexota bacterium]
MRANPLNRFVRGLSVAASSSVLVFAAVGSASAHPLSLTTSTGVDAAREALAALILRYEPFEDAAGIDSLVDEVLVSWPAAATLALDLLDDDDDADDESDDADDESDDADDESDDADDESDDADDDADDAEDDADDAEDESDDAEDD